MTATLTNIVGLIAIESATPQLRCAGRLMHMRAGRAVHDVRRSKVLN